MTTRADPQFFNEHILEFYNFSGQLSLKFFISMLPMMVAFFLNGLHFCDSIYISFTNTAHKGNVLIFFTHELKQRRAFYTKEQMTHSNSVSK